MARSYKFDTDKKSLKKIPILINTVFNDFKNESKKFDFYRQNIREEKADFMKNCSSFFENLSQNYK